MLFAIKDRCLILKWLLKSSLGKKNTLWTVHLQWWSLAGWGVSVCLLQLLRVSKPGRRWIVCYRVESPVPCRRTVTVPWRLTWALGVKWLRPAASARGYQTAAGPISCFCFYFWVVSCEGKRLQDKCLQNCFAFCYTSRSFKVVLASDGLVCCC